MANAYHVYEPILPASNNPNEEGYYLQLDLPLPTPANKNNKCDCRDWCSYRRCGIIVTAFLAVILVIGLAVYFTGNDPGGLSPGPPSPDPKVPYNSTEKCDEDQLKHRIDERVECYERASIGLDLALAARKDLASIRKELCLSIADKVKCNSALGSHCFNSTQTDNLIHNYLVIEFDKAHNLSEILGEEFVKSCPSLRDNEKSIVSYLADSTACTYIEYMDAFNSWNECKDRAILENAERRLREFEDSSERRSHLEDSICTLRKDHDACYPDIISCAGGETRATLIEERNNFVDSLLKLMNKNGKTFSFEQSCSDVH